ncbi:MAG: ABC transporter permease, partial [Caulobacter sp.]|nr:ABC transporter permease [Caulobacter sp.]
MAAVQAAIPGIFKPLRTIGRSTLGALRMVGGVGVFALRGVVSVFTPPWFPIQLVRQLAAIGFFSLPVVGLTAIFTGAALGLNIYTGGGRFNAEQVMPQIVALGITRELGPVLAALM